MRKRLTKLEMLVPRHSSILTITKQALDHGKSSRATAQILNRKFKLHLTKSAVEKFRAKRWQRQRDQLEKQKTDYAAKAQLIKEKGLGAAAQALLFEQVRQLNPSHLLGIMRIEVQKDRLKLAKKALAKGNAQNDPNTLPMRTPEEIKAAHLQVANTMRGIFGLSEIGEDGLPIEETPDAVEAEQRRLTYELSQIPQRLAKAKAHGQPQTP